MLFFSTLMLLSGMACTFMPVFSAFLSIWIGKNTVCQAAFDPHNTENDLSDFTDPI
jgi:hypothetical protein